MGIFQCANFVKKTHIPKYALKTDIISGFRSSPQGWFLRRGKARRTTPARIVQSEVREGTDMPANRVYDPMFRQVCRFSTDEG